MDVLYPSVPLVRRQAVILHGWIPRVTGKPSSVTHRRIAITLGARH
jgi:hypothetical protein